MQHRISRKGNAVCFFMIHQVNKTCPSPIAAVKSGYAFFYRKHRD